MKRWVITMLGLLMAVTFCCETVAQAQEKKSPVFVDEDGDGIDDRATFRHRQARSVGGGALLSVLSAQLTEAQRTALQAKINALLASGASADEIQKAVFAELEGFGVDLTGAFLTRFDKMLTKDQKVKLRKKAEALKAKGAAYGDIQRAMQSEMASMGIAWNKRDSDPFGAMITKDQMSALQKKIDGLVAGGASRIDVQKAIDKELKAMGIDLPSRARRNPSDFWRDRRKGRGSSGRGGQPHRPEKKSDKKDSKMRSRLIRR